MSEIKLTRRYPDSKPEDITDAYMRGVAAGMEIANSQHERRIDALERRIVKLESRTAASEGRLDGMTDGVLLRFEAIEQRVERMERKLHHKGGDE